MNTKTNSTKWIFKLTAALGLAVAAARPVWAHGGGGGGHSGGSHMGVSSISAKSFNSGMNRNLSTFKNSNFASNKFNTNQLQATKLNNFSNNTSNALKNTIKPINTIKPKFPTGNTGIVGATTLNKANFSKVSQIGKNNTVTNGAALLHKNHIGNPLSNANHKLPAKFNMPSQVANFNKNGNSHHHHGGFPWYLALLPYGFGGYGGYGWYGNSYGSPNYIYSPVVTSPVATPVVATNNVPGIDLQLTDVRMVDNGDPSRQIGPLYRVSLRNVGSTPVDHDFNVALIAADDADLNGNLPTSESRVHPTNTDAVINVDVRLPATAFSMGPDKHSEFSKLFVFVDSQGEVTDANRDNNVAGLDRTNVQPAS